MTTAELQVQNNPSEMIRYAIEKNATVDQLGKLLELKERYEANEARKAYHVAMAAFKADPPKIKKDKKVGYESSRTGGSVGYSHASLGNVTELINAGLSKHGLSASWTPSQNGEQISVTTKITHKLGHSEEATLTSKADATGSKNPIQAIGSTITYLERYGLLALTGLATYEIDDDGQAAVSSFISEKELSQLRDHLASEELPEAKCCAHLRVDSLEKLPKSELKRAMSLKKATKK